MLRHLVDDFAEYRLGRKCLVLVTNVGYTCRLVLFVVAVVVVVLVPEYEQRHGNFLHQQS